MSVKAPNEFMRNQRGSHFSADFFVFSFFYLYICSGHFDQIINLRYETHLFFLFYVLSRYVRISTGSECGSVSG